MQTTKLTTPTQIMYTDGYQAIITNHDYTLKKPITVFEQPTNQNHNDNMAEAINRQTSKPFAKDTVTVTLNLEKLYKLIKLLKENQNKGNQEITLSLFTALNRFPVTLSNANVTTVLMPIIK